MHPALKTPSFDDSQAKNKTKTFRQRVTSLSSVKIICLLIFFSLLLPFVAILMFMGTATVFSHQWLEKDSQSKLTARPKILHRSPSIETTVHSTNKKKKVRTDGTGIKEKHMKASSSSSSSSSIGSAHFLVEQRDIAIQNCIEKYHRPKKSQDVKENVVMSIPINGASQHYIFQLCFADDHDHQHTFHIKVHNAVNSDADCDMYLSATSPSPDIGNWDWKSANKGADDITLHTYMEEFQSASLNALFLTVTWNEKQSSIMTKGRGKTKQQLSNSEREKDKCILTMEIVPLSNEELLHKLPTLRGGRVLLPRDLEQIKATGSINEIN